MIDAGAAKPFRFDPVHGHSKATVRLAPLPL
jgi:hypothetical protein